LEPLRNHPDNGAAFKSDAFPATTPRRPTAWSLSAWAAVLAERRGARRVAGKGWRWGRGQGGQNRLTINPAAGCISYDPRPRAAYGLAA